MFQNCDNLLPLIYVIKGKSLATDLKDNSFLDGDKSLTINPQGDKLWIDDSELGGVNSVKINKLIEKGESVFDEYEKNIGKLLSQKQYMLYYKVENKMPEILTEMHQNGIKVDIIKMRELGIEYKKKMHELEKKIFAISGVEFNIASPKQLGKILFEDLGIELTKKSKKTGNYSTSQEVMELLSVEGYEIAGLIVQWRFYGKLIATYVDPILQKAQAQTHRIHTTFNNYTVATGRLSSTNPNMQNIPIRDEEGFKIRGNFIANEGKLLVSIDYSQIELRVLAHIADVDVLQKAFFDDLDIHAITASQIFSVDIKEVDNLMRRKAKAINFGIIYGMGAYGLANRLKISFQEAKEYIEKYFIQYPGIKKYMVEIVEYCKNHGYITTLMGRRCVFSNIRNSQMKSIERAVINAPIQGSASDIIKLAMVKVYEYMKSNKLKSRLLLQVHDELLFEVEPDEISCFQVVIKNIMEKVIELKVPLKVDLKQGENWAKMS